MTNALRQAFSLRTKTIHTDASEAGSISQRFHPKLAISPFS
jgi:hypothetical protein